MGEYDPKTRGTTCVALFVDRLSIHIEDNESSPHCLKPAVFAVGALGHGQLLNQELLRDDHNRNDNHDRFDTVCGTFESMEAFIKRAHGKGL